jgi:hypothetical protein
MENRAGSRREDSSDRSILGDTLGGWKSRCNRPTGIDNGDDHVAAQRDGGDGGCAGGRGGAQVELVVVPVVSSGKCEPRLRYSSMFDRCAGDLGLGKVAPSIR